MVTILTVDVETWQPVPEGYEIDWDIDVIEPLQQLESLLRKHGQKAVLMVEFQELLWLKSQNQCRIAIHERVLQQLLNMKDVVEYGLHFHPAWVNATRKGDDVMFSKTQRMLELSNPYYYLLKGLRYMLKHLRARPRAFRAAKYQICDHPDGKSWIRAHGLLLAIGMKVDTSVWPGAHLPSHGVDYRGAPTNPYYPDVSDITTPNNQLDIKEYPILADGNGRYDMAKVEDRFLKDDRDVKVMIGHTKGQVDWSGLEQAMKSDEFKTFQEIEKYD